MTSYMEPNHRHLIVTLASRDYIENAKQLFSSVYHNAGWRGDYLLLAHDVPESDLDWFHKKGILVRHCPPLDIKINHEGYPVTILAKFYLFTSYFRQWQKVIFLDADIIVLSSLDGLLKTTGLAAARDLINGHLQQQINHEDHPQLFAELRKNYRLSSPAFNTGVLAFDTGIITDDLFSRLIEIHKKFGELNYYWEQGTMNLVFYRQWAELPSIYNFFPGACDYYNIPKDKFQAILIHFPGTEKPWAPGNQFYPLWLNNLEQAENFDSSHPLPAASVWSRGIIETYIFYLRLRRTLWPNIWLPRLTLWLKWLITRPEWGIGQIGQLIKKISPNTYYKLTRQKSTPPIKPKEK